MQPQPIDVISALVIAVLIIGLIFALARQEARRAANQAEYEANEERCRREREAQEQFDANARRVPHVLTFSSAQRSRALEIANRGRAN
jgi:type II secretory pathway pseudopilin PulG